MGESMGWKANLELHSAADFTSGTPVAMKYLSNTLQEVIDLTEDDGIRCERDLNVADVAQTNKQIAGDIVFNHTPIELGRILPYVGMSVSTNTWTLTDAMSDMYVRTYMGASGAELFDFLVRINRVTMLIEPGRKVQWTHNCVGKTLTPSAIGVYAFHTIDDLSRPFMAYDLGSTTGITVNSVANYCDRIELIIDNLITPTFMTGQTATDLEPGGRIVTLNVRYKFNSAAEKAIFDDMRAGTSRAISFTLTNGGTSLLTSLGACVPRGRSPVVESRDGKIRQEVSYSCRKTGSTGSVVMTLDQTA